LDTNLGTGLLAAGLHDSKMDSTPPALNDDSILDAGTQVSRFHSNINISTVSSFRDA
jgi:hypothetical protein